MKNFTKEELMAIVEELEESLCYVETKLVSKKKLNTIGRKQEVLKILQKGAVSISAISSRLGISSKNVSSQLTYLRKDGYNIMTDSIGRKVLMKD